MKLEQLDSGAIEIVRVVLDGDEPPPTLTKGGEVGLVRNDDAEQVFLRAGERVAAVRGASRRDQQRLESLLATRGTLLVWAVDVAPPEVLLQVHAFVGVLVGLELTLTIDPQALDDAQRATGRRHTLASLRALLHEQCVLDPAIPEGAQRLFVSGGTGRDLDGAFTVHGRSMRIVVRRQGPVGSASRYVVSRFVRGAGPGQGERTFLVEGRLTLAADGAPGESDSDTDAQLARLGAEGGVLDLWTRWHTLEADALLERARDRGTIAYERVEELLDGRCRFVLTEEGRQRLDNDLVGESLECAATPPLVLTNDLTWAEYEAMSRDEARPAAAFVGTVLSVLRREGAMVLAVNRGGGAPATPPASGVLFVSILGDRTRLRRQREATEAIRNGTNPMPGLAGIIEDLDVPIGRPGSLKLSRRVSRKVFGERGPTRKQEEAIRIALNTPDVALIQGPPGTGKTTVITALVEQLNELADASEDIDQVLVTGFQHDAVENAIARMSVNGLPALKFGARHGATEDEETVDAGIDRWCQERAETLRARLPTRSPSTLAREVEQLIEGYLLAPLPRVATSAMLDRLARQVSGQVSTATVEQVRAVARVLAAPADQAAGATADLTRCIRALRTTAVAFADDGPLSANLLLRALTTASPALSPRFDSELRALLAEAAAWRAAEAPPFLDRLAVARRRLLVTLVADPFPDAQPRLREDVAAALAAVRDALAARPARSQDVIADAAGDLLAAYEGDPELVKRSLLAYMAVAAATCQQSERLFVHERHRQPYQTVIVDEAARANPLDLFIPLAQAARRVVLVGDHRQLPHILDRQLELELERALRRDESSAAERTKELLGRSLFQQLFEHLAHRQERGEGQRVVTLDEQFRMPKQLGDFVSREFYPGRESFRSPLPPEGFAHGLPGYSSPAAWLDVGRDHGFERPGRSKSRSAEAAAIVEELDRLIDTPAAATLNIGIITFYKDQVKVIANALHAGGFVDGDGRIVDRYRDLARPDPRRPEQPRIVERLRYGTVDAFQGMEFDVVFLSMVRCNQEPDGDERARRARYGHLMSPNRLCVAMSRQQRLLVVVGDAAMLHGPGAEAAIGPLVRFHAMAEVRSHAV